MNIQKGITAILFAVVIASVLALTVSPASATSLFLGPYELQNWDTSGPGTTSITPMSGAACSATFSYDHTPSTYNWETWQFETTAAQTETLSFDWEYSGCHSWFHSKAQAYVFADGPSGRTTKTLYSGGGCGFSANGSSSIQVNNGYSFGFIVKGKHYDYSRILRGSLTISTPDTTPPDISVTVSPDTLWPPNHKMVDIVATVAVSDICDAAPTVVLTSVTSDEPDDAKGGGDGKTVDDIQGTDIGAEDYEFQLRAERAGKGDGRTYTITYTATDASGNSANASATVVVPHDMD